MDIDRAGSQPSTKGSTDYFTGRVRVDPLFQAPAPVRVSGAAVTFEPGARTGARRCIDPTSSRRPSTPYKKPGYTM
jgi:hypothetical protein